MWENSFSFSIAAIRWSHGPKWNPVRMKRQDPLFPPRYHLQGLVQQFWSYLRTTTNGKVKLYIKMIKENLDYFSKWGFHRFRLWLLKFELCIFWTMRSSRKWRVAKQQEKGLGNRNYFFMTAKRMDIECHSKNVFAAVDRQGKAGR